MQTSREILALAVLCLLAAPGCQKQTPEERALELIQQLGGKVSYQNGAVASVDLSGTKAQDGLLAAISLFPRVHSINCTNAEGINGSGLGPLADLKELQTLYLVGTAVDDDGVKNLSGLTSLHTLHLGRTRITDAGLPAVDSLTGLRTLSLGDTEVTDAGLVQLRDLRELSTLILKRTKVTKRGVSDLRRTLPNARIEF